MSYHKDDLVLIYRTYFKRAKKHVPLYMILDVSILYIFKFICDGQVVDDKDEHEGSPKVVGAQDGLNDELAMSDGDSVIYWLEEVFCRRNHIRIPMVGFIFLCLFGLS